MNRPMEELSYKTHYYSTCPKVDKDCDECERYYWEEIHADFCDESCPQRTETEEKVCSDCICEHCEGKVKRIK